MTHIKINTINELLSFDFTELNIIEDIFIDIRLKLIDQELDFPINIFHKESGKESKLSIKIALFGKSKVKIPVSIHVRKGATDTATDFKALVYIMSKQSSANITPGLFIEERNIRSASHGIVIKNIKDKDLEYIRARGVEKEKAKDILIAL